MQISRENTSRRVYVGVNVQGRDVDSMVQEIQQKMEAQLELPSGYYIRYGGAFENLQEAQQRLQIVVPIALALIFILLYFALNSVSQAVMICVAVPLAAIGGVFALRSEEHTSELQSRGQLVCRLLLEKRSPHHELWSAPL